MANIPALPNGFRMDVQGEVPALPDGFALDAPDSVPTLPDGFALDNAPASAPTPTVTWRDDLRAGLLAARQGANALTDVAPGMDAMKAARSHREQADRADTLAQLGVGGGDPERSEYLRQLAMLQETAGRKWLIDGATRIGELGKEAANYPADPKAAAALGAEDWFGPDGAITLYLENPGVTTRTALLRSLPAMAPTIAATVAGSAAGPVGAGIAGGGTSAATEYGMSVSEGLQQALQEAKVDPTDEAALTAFATQNPDVMDEILQDAAVRAGLIGSVDAATGGIAGKLVQTPKNAGRARRVAGVASGATVETLGEGVGEAAAQLGADGKISAGEVIGEVVGAGPLSVPQVAGQAVVEASRASPEQREADAIARYLNEEPARPDVAAPVTDAANTATAEQPAAPTLPEGFTLDPTPEAAPQEQRFTASGEATATVEQPVDARVDVKPAAAPVETTEIPVEPPAPAVASDPQTPAADVELQAADVEPTEQVAAPTEQVPEPNWNDAVKDAPELRRNQPLTSAVRRSVGGFKYRRKTAEGGTELTPIAQELAARGITFRTHPYLWNNNGVENVDNLVEREVFDAPGVLPTDGTGNYLDQGALIDAMADELTGGPATYTTRDARERAALHAQQQADYEQSLRPQEPVAPQATPDPDGELDVNEGEVPPYDADAAGFDPDYHTRRQQQVAQQVDDTAQAIGAENTLTAAERRAIIADLTQNGGHVEDAIVNYITRNADDHQSGTAGGITEAATDVPFGPEPAAGEVERVSTPPENVGRAGRGQAETYQTELTPEGEQTLIPGTEVRQTGEAQRARAEQEVLQQQSRLRKPNQKRVEDDPDSLFAPQQDDMLAKMEAPTTPADAEPKQQRVRDDTTGEVYTTLTWPDGSTSEIVRDADGTDYGLSGWHDRSVIDPSKVSYLGETKADAIAAMKSRRENAAPAKKKTSGGSGKMADFGGAPSISEASTNSGLSKYRQAYRDAGLDPDDANLMPAAKKIDTFVRLLKDKFGIKMLRGEGRKRGTANDVVESALDAYRNMQFMAHALGLPLKALGLRDTLSLSFDKANRFYLGLYNSATQTIHMPGRSNSFAHEWAHALDHYLSRLVAPAHADKLLSRVTRAEGIDPADSLAAAYVNLIHRLFFDEADLAAQMLRLEIQAAATIQKGPNAGQPTAAALKARKSLDRMLQGATRIKVDPSAYRQTSAEFSPAKAGYYASVHELLARAFEAYVAFKVGGVGGTNEFISKGEAAYLNEADAALASLYPTDGDRIQIFRAFDEIMGHLATHSTLADGTAADAPADVDVLDPARIAKLALTDTSETLGTALKTEFARVRNMTKALFSDPRAALGQTTSALAINAGVAKQTGETNKGYLFRAANRAAHIGRTIVLSMRGATKAVVREQPKAAQPALQFLLDRVMTDHGTGRNIDQTFEEARELRTNQEGAKITRLLKASGLENWTTGRLKQADNDTIRALLLGKKVPGASANLRKVATELRNIMSAAYERAKDAGIEMGFVEDTGYIPRVLLHARIQARPGDFVKDATRLYEVVFDQTTADMDPDDVVALASEVSRRVDPTERPADGPFASQIKRLRDAIKAHQQDPLDVANVDELHAAVDDLLDAIKADFAETSAHAWKERIVGGDSMSFDSLGPAANFTKSRTLPKEADDILAAWYDTDVLTGTLNYVHSVEARAQYHSRFGKPGGTDRVDLMLRRKDVAARVKANPRKYNTKTPEGRLRIIQDLADVSRDNIKEMALNEAVKAGADGDAVGQVRANIEEITGRARSNGIKHMDRLSASLFALGYIALLPRAAWSSIVEPTTILMRTGSVKAAMKTYQRYAMEAVRGAKSTRELQAIAEAVGLVSTPLHDVVLLNRMSGDHGNVVSGNTLLTRFFRANFLSQLTNAQRRSVMVGGTLWLRDLAKQYNDPEMDAAGRASIEAEFNELGIGGDKLSAMIDWLANGDGMPSLDDLHSPQGQAYGAAIARFTDQTIQNPRRADKPMGASSSMGRLVYALMSFNYTLFANVHAATAKRSKTHKQLAQDAGENSMNVASAAVEPYLATAMGFSALFAGQVVVGALRAMIYNADQWEDKEEKGELGGWLGWTAFSRSGILGPADVLLNAANGLRYERDLTSLMVGATPSWILSNVQNILKGLPKGELYEGGPGIGLRNSANTNTAEHTALKSAYNLFAVPTANAGLAALPAPGPIGAAAKFGAMQFLSSSTAASWFADSVVGEKGSKTQ